jgi:SAM-dependent methyltransferase/quercetin dioxygenase-like cupin family protein
MKTVRAPADERVLDPISVPAGGGEARWWGETLAVIKATGADTRGQVAILEITEPPGAEAPRHVHHREDEGFWVLEGDVTFDVGGTTIAAREGDYAFAPRDVPHSYRVGADGCRMLFIVTPAGFEDLVRRMSVPAANRAVPPSAQEPTDVEDLPALLAAYGCELVEADTTRPHEGSAGRQAAMWGERATDWAEVMEGPNGWGIPVYERILERVPIDESTRLLDVGCGSGRFCRIARDRGATVAGLDATREFIAIARERTPEGEFVVGEMERLPWPDDSFDVVTGFHSFFLAEDMARALREARRVARPGGTVALTIWGRPERCDSTGLFAAMRRLVEGEAAASDEPEPKAARAPALHDEEVIVGIARGAGLHPTEVAYFGYVEEYPDVDTAVRGMLAAPPGRAASRATSADEVRDALGEAVRPHLSDTGTVRLREEVRYLIATA